MAWEEADSPGGQWEIRRRQEERAAGGNHRRCRSVGLVDSAVRPRVCAAYFIAVYRCWLETWGEEEEEEEEALSVQRSRSKGAASAASQPRSFIRRWANTFLPWKPLLASGSPTLFDKQCLGKENHGVLSESCTFNRGVDCQQGGEMYCRTLTIHHKSHFNWATKEKLIASFFVKLY